jgi:hypothetical protein
MGKWFVKQFDEVKAEVAECRHDRDKLWERLADLNRKIETK